MKLLTIVTLILIGREGTGLKIIVPSVSHPLPPSDGDLDVMMPNITLLNSTSEYYGDVANYRDATPSGDLIFQNETVYVVPNSRNFLVFQCTATYPVVWNLAEAHVHSNVYHAVRVMSIRKWKDPFDSTTFKYVTLLTLDGPSPRLTGNYSCQSAARSYIQSNIFIFWESSFGSIFVNSKENLTVSTTSSAGTIRLPCQVTDPDSIPKLMKMMGQNTSSYQDLQLNESIVYSPPVGFTLKNLPNPSGTYKCVLDGNEFVSVRVLQKNDSPLAAKPYTFDYDDRTKQVKCCAAGETDGRKSPKIYMMECQHPSTCALREHLSADSITYIWNQGRRRGNCAIFDMRHYHTGVLRCAGSGFDTYREFIVPIDEYQPSWNEKRNTTTYFRWEEIDPQKMIVVRSSTIHETSYWALTRRKPGQEGDGIIYSNQSVQVACHTSRYYFATGAYWMLRWKNQTLTELTDQLDESGNVKDYQYYVDRDRHLDTVGLIAQPDMEAAICFAPVWNSSLWVSKMHFLYVNESIAPLITNPVEVVNYTWYANETGRTLACSASGLPAPEFHWEKDNVTILPSTHNYNVFTPNVTEPTVATTPATTTTTTTTTAAPSTTESTTPVSNSSIPPQADGMGNEDVNNEGTRPASATVHTSVLIARVSYSTHGVFRCVATNVGGSATKEFHITVLESKSWTVTGLLVGASVLAILLTVGIIYLLKRLYEDRREINQLAVDSLSRSSSVNFSHGGGSCGNGFEGSPPVVPSSRNGIGNGRTEDGPTHSITVDNGIMSKNLIDTF